MEMLARCCRLCLSENEETLKCEESDRSVLLRERIRDLLSIDIKQNDALSQLVCDACSQKVNDWCEFKKNCQINQTTSSAENSAEEWTVHVKEEIIEDYFPSENYDTEIMTENITVKTEPLDFENYDASMTNDTFDHSKDVGEDELPTRVEDDEHENEEQETEAPVALEERTFSEDSHSEKVIFAAGLKLIERGAIPIEMENLSELESSYLEKCKAMVDMYRSLKCTCHMATYPNLKALLSHLRSLKMCFPVFTCYNCMITFTDRSSSSKHIHRCPNKNLETLVKLSNLKRRSNLKTRIYQNYRCINCKFIFAFHEDYCRHVDEEHCNEIAPLSCICLQTFHSLEDYKDHIYVSCKVEYYCDICNIAVRSLKEFINHAKQQHDNSEGFSLLQEDNYKRTFHKVQPRESSGVSVKRRRSTYSRAQTTDEDDVASSMYPRSSRNVPTKCPQCDKVYSCHSNMLRHFRIHQKEVEKEHPEPDALKSSYYRRAEERFESRKSGNQEEMDYHTCEKCFKVFASRYSLKMHMKLHGINLTSVRKSKSLKKFDRNSCDTTSANNEALISHIDGEHAEMQELDEVLHHVPYIFTCDVSVKTFSKATPLVQHRAKHYTQEAGPSHCKYPKFNNANKGFNCKICNKSFSSQPAMVSHQGWHKRTSNEGQLSTRPEKPVVTPRRTEFECNVCGQELPNDIALSIHRIEKHGNAAALLTPRCESCNREFGSQTDYENHIKLHEIVENRCLDL